MDHSDALNRQRTKCRPICAQSLVVSAIKWLLTLYSLKVGATKVSPELGTRGHTYVSAYGLTLHPPVSDCCHYISDASVSGRLRT